MRRLHEHRRKSCIKSFGIIHSPGIDLLPELLCVLLFDFHVLSIHRCLHQRSNGRGGQSETSGHRARHSSSSFKTGQYQIQCSLHAYKLLLPLLLHFFVRLRQLSLVLAAGRSGRRSRQTRARLRHSICKGKYTLMSSPVIMLLGAS